MEIVASEPSKEELRPKLFQDFGPWMLAKNPQQPQTSQTPQNSNGHLSPNMATKATNGNSGSMHDILPNLENISTDSANFNV